MSNELAQLFPTGKEITIRDENLTIKPFKFGELPRVFKAIEPLSASITALVQTQSFNASSIGFLFSSGGDGILDLLAVGTRKPRSWVDDLEMDEGIEVLTAVLEVNADFFIQKVLPRINEALEKSSGRTSS